MTATRMPLAAVGMIAAHLYLERVKTADMLPRDLDRTLPGTNGRTYSDHYALTAAVEAWRIAKAVEDAAPVVSVDSQGVTPSNQVHINGERLR